MMEKAHCEECRKDLWEHLQTVAREHAIRNPSSGDSFPARERRICAGMERIRITPCGRAWRNGENARSSWMSTLDKVKAPFFREMEAYCADSRPVSRDRKTPV
ncbi:MAG: hypothetical protein ACLT8E_01240 [Akkermansia sp.]